MATGNNLVTPPTFTGTIQQDYLIEPLQGMARIDTYLRDYPTELYTHNPHSLLVKFLTTLLGPTGVGLLAQNYLEARLIFEEANMNTDNLEAFYGDPFGFLRSISEFPVGDYSGMLTNGAWEAILAQNASYRNRAIDFLHGVRFGNSPRGLRLIAKSGVGQTCEVIENYKYLFDVHSDDPIGLPYYGQTLSTEELIVVPNNEISQTQVQTITVNPTGPFNVTVTPASGGAVPSGTHYWQVTAIVAGLETLPSAQVSANITSGKANLTWQAVVNATSYNIYRSSASGDECLNGSLVAMVPGLMTAHSDTALTGSAGGTLSETFQLYFNGSYAPQAAQAFGFNPHTQIVATALVNIDITDPGTSVFGGTYVIANQVVRLAFQDGTSGDNGIYVFTGSGSAMVLAPMIFADCFTLQLELQKLANIGDNVYVTGGPSVIAGILTFEPYIVTFQNVLSNQPIPEIMVVPDPNAPGFVSLPYTVSPLPYTPNTIVITTSSGYLDGAEVLNIGQADLHSLQVALDRVKSVTTIPTVHPFTSIFQRQAWNNIYASTEQTAVLRYVTGRTNVNWPAVDNFHWIIKGTEVEAPRVEADPQHDYEGFHTAVNFDSSSAHVGPFNPIQQVLYPILAKVPSNTFQFIPAYSMSPTAGGPSDWTISQVGTTNQGAPLGLIEGIYPFDYVPLTGVIINPQAPSFWASNEATDGAETLIIDLGAIKGINYIDFEMTQKPFSIDISYDIANQNFMNFKSVTPDLNYSFTDFVGPVFNSQNPWATLEYHFTNGVDPIIFTRYIRITFTRGLAPTVFGTAGWSVEVRNLRVGRVVGT